MRPWRLVGWTLALLTLSFAFGVVEEAFRDLYALADCGAGGDASQCQEHRLMWAAAEVAVVLTRVPAIGLAIIAAVVWWLGRSQGAGGTARGAAAGEDAAGGGDAVATQGAVADQEVAAGAAGDAVAGRAGRAAGSRAAGRKAREAAAKTA